MSNSLQSTASTVRHGAKRADYQRETVYALLDELLVCQIGQHVDGRVVVTPTCHWRDGDYLYWHAHAHARSCAGAAGSQVCINLCSLDGLVMARSAFNHSVNYRSVTLFGVPEAVTDPTEKLAQLKRFVDRFSSGRWETLRPIRDEEIRATSVVRMLISDASVKVRQGPPADDKADLEWPVWAGEMRLQRQWQALADSDNGSTEPELKVLASRV